MHPTELLAPTDRPTPWSASIGSALPLQARRRDRPVDDAPAPLVVWVPVAIGVGMVAYFALWFEPPLWPAAATVLVLAGSSLQAARHGWNGTAIALAALALSAFGFTAGSMATLIAEVPMLNRPLDPVGIEGRVVAIETQPSGLRLTLDQLMIEELSPEATPRRIRIRTPAGGAAKPGDRIRALAGLQPPSEPAMPGAFDFRRQAYFQGLGAVGFSYGRPTVIEEAHGAAPDPAESLREAIAGRIRLVLEGDEAELAVALTTGERSAMSAEAVDAMRASGLAHLLAISGLHIGLVAGLVFGLLRLSLAAHPWTAVKLPTKAISALVALLAALAYVWLIGAPIPTRRAAIMTGLALFGVAIGRQAFSLRLIAVAATVVMLMSPESVLGPSFQLSFGAVLALIVVARHLSDRPVVRPGGGTVWWRMRRSLGSALAATLAATAATTPIALYHFQQVPTWGVIANLVAIPLNGIAIMPAVVASFVLMPFGLEAPALWCLGQAVSALLWIATTVADWPGAVLRLPAMPGWGYGLVALGGIWICLVSGVGRSAGALAMLAGLLSLAIVRPPDILVAASGRLIAVVADDGILSPSTRRTERFSLEVWEERTALETGPAWPVTGDATSAGIRCDPDACIWARGGQTIAFARTIDGYDEECDLSDLVVTGLFPPFACSQPSLVIDRRDLNREGAHAIWIGEEAVRVTTVADDVGDRPWSAHRRPPFNGQP